MDFTEAVNEHDKGNDMCIYSKIDYIWDKNITALKWTVHKAGIGTESFNIDDVKATDWAVVEEDKSLSNKVIEIPSDNVGGTVKTHLMYYENDIKNFIDKIKREIAFILDAKGISTVMINIKIDKLAGDRFR